MRDTLEDIPRGARASDKARVRRYLSFGEASAPKGTDFAVTDKEFSAHVVAFSMQSTTELLAWVQAFRAKATSLPADERAIGIGMEAYCFKHQVDLQRRLDFAWEVHRAPASMAQRRMSAWDMVAEASRSAACICNGAWKPLTESLLHLHCDSMPAHAHDDERPAPQRVKDAIRQALQDGCKKHTNLFVYGPNTSGKSHVLKPLAEIFDGCAFLRPVGKGNYPLQEIFGSKVCVLQDVRVSTFKLDFDSLLVWFEGEKFPVPLPRNSHSKDKWYNERAPIFISSGSKFRIPEAEARRLQVDAEEQNRMMDARFQFFHFARSLSKHEKVECAPCARCFAEWLCTETSSPERPVTQHLAPSQGPSPQEAAEAILDWIETHGGEVRTFGNDANISQLADDLQWSQKYLATCGRLLPFCGGTERRAFRTLPGSLE